MPNLINDQTFTTSRGTLVNIYKDYKLNKQYYNKLKTNINSFLNKENHANASRDDVAKYFQRKHFINGDVRSNQEFIKLLNSKVAENRTGLEPDSPAGEEVLRETNYSGRYHEGSEECW